MSSYYGLDLGELGALPADWHDQLAHQDADAVALALAGDQLVLEQGEADPPEVWGVLELGGRGGGAGGGPGGPRTETLRGTVRRVSNDGGGLIVAGTGDPDVDESWINASRYARTPVRFTELRAGQAVELEVTRAKTGRVYVEALRPLDATPPGAGDAGEDSEEPPF
jgi:hypothetical protein